MKGYKFPLQKLLDMRIEKEDESKRSFMEAQRQRALAEEKLNSLNDNYNRFNSFNQEDDIIKRKLRDNYLIALRQNIEHSKHELQKKTESVDLHREDLKQKQIDRKTVEKLKEKRLDAFKKEMEEKERKANDEFALYSYIRKIERG